MAKSRCASNLASRCSSGVIADAPPRGKGVSSSSVYFWVAAGAAAVASALELEGVDELGLDEIDRKYLGVLADVYEGGPAGLEAIAATMGGDAGTLEDVVEPYLLQIGFLSRTPRGRKLTAAGASHLRR